MTRARIGRCIAVAPFTAAVLIAGLAAHRAAASRATAAAVQTAPVVFSHPDEMVKGNGFLVLADRRIFAVMAFLNAVGYDHEAEGQTMHPARVQARERVARALTTSPGKLEAWRRLYKSQGLATFQYMDFALSLSAEPPFRRLRADGELTYPKTAKTLADFPEVLNDFWRTADLDHVWSEVKPAYMAEIAKYDPERFKRKLSFTWEYLRMPRSDTYTIVNVPNLLDAHFESIGAHYENYYYSVESPGSTSYDLNVHEYLHSIVNDLVAAAYDANKARITPYYRDGKNGPLAATYQSPVTFTYECLVRALDHRLAVKLSGTPRTERRAAEVVADETAKGLTLTGPFYALLPGYESSGQGFDAYLPTLMSRLPETPEK